MKNFIFKSLLILLISGFSILNVYAQGTFTATGTIVNTNLVMDNISATTIEVDRFFPGGQLSHSFTLSSGVWTGVDNGTVSGTGTATLTVTNTGFSNVTINDTGNNDPDISFIGAIAMTNSNFNLNGVGNVTNETLSFSLGFSRINWNVTSIDIVNAGILIKCGISAITATGDITLEEVNAFDSSQGNGCSVLSIDTPGITRLNDDITGFGGIGSLSIGGGGTTIINHLPSFPNSPSIAAFGSMTFEPGENVILENGARIQSLTAGIITYGGKVDGPFNLISQGGTTIFSEDVGATTLLNGFYSPSNTSTVIIQGEQFNTTTFQDFEGGVVLTNANPVSIQSGVSFNVDGQLNTAKTTTITATNISLRGSLFIGNNNMPGVTSLIGNSDFQKVGNQTHQMRFYIDSFGTAGTDYSKLNVNGTIDLANISLSLINSFFGTPPTTPITIIENDGTDPIVGTFNGLMEGATVTSNGENWTVSYVGGTGNDVVLIPPPPPNVYVDTSGNLVIEDNDDKDDTIRIFRFGGSYRIIDTANELYAGSGTFQINPNTVQVDLSVITGSINVNLNGGDDALILDYTVSDIQDIVNYNGGTQNSTNPGDVLSLISGTRIYDTISHTLISENDGNISITNQAAINYVGLEPITDNLRGRNRIFNFTGGAETILLQNDATSNMNFIDSTIGESITFRNPITSLIINAGNGNDIINLETLDAFFGSSITVNGDAGNDTYNQNSAITIQNTSSAFIVQTVETFSQTAALSTLGSITYNIGSSVTLNETNAGSNLIISALGDVTSSNLINIGGTTSIDALGQINVNTPIGNSFTGIVNLTAARIIDFTTNAPIQFGMITLSDVNNVTSTVTNNGQTTAFTQNVTTAALHDFTIRSSGIVSQITGSAITTDALTINAQSANVILANAINDVNSLEVTNGGDVSFTDIDDINVLNTTSNTLNVTSGGALTSSGIKNINDVGISSLTSGGALNISGTINQNAGILNLESPTAISLGHTHTSAANTTTNINGGTGTVSTAGTNLTFFDLSVNAGNYQTNGNTTTINGVATINDTASLIGIGTIDGEVSIANGGEIAPGNSPGILSTDNTSFQSNSNLAIEINGFTTPGTEFDQLQVTGSVSLTGAVLNLIDGIALNIPDNTEIVIIANDGTDAVIGEFTSSNADGFNGQRLRVIYDGGDGNDVAIVVGIPNVEIVAGDLIIIDNEDRDDNITIIISGTNYLITDPINELIVGTGGTQVDANTISIPIALVTGTIEVQTMGGDDNFTTDFSGGNFSDVINYDGGNQNSTHPGDILAITGGGTFTTVEHTFINENDGNVMVTGNSPINYVGLEPVSDNVDATNRIFTFTGGAETITLENETTPGSNIIDSTLGEAITFTNPSATLTINAGSGDDIINIQGVDVAFDADLTVNGDADIDRVNFQINETNVTSGDILVITERIEATQNITTTGNISFTTDKNIDVILGSVIQSTDGDINFQAGLAPLPGDGYTGIIVNGGTVQTTGTGNISLTGTGFGIDFRKGVEVAANASIITSGSGSISLNGFGATVGNSDQAGITLVNNVVLRSNGGGITLNGTGGGDSAGVFNDGIAAFDTITIEDINGGNVNLTGQSGFGTGTKAGIYLGGPNVFVRTTNGNIQLNGTGSPGTGNFNDGVLVEGGTVVEATGTGMISINGTGGTSVSENTGVSINGLNTMLQTNGGGIIVNGTSGASTGDNNIGTIIAEEALINDTANGNLGITGTGGNGTVANHGVSISEMNTTISATNGNISINGTSNNLVSAGINFGSDIAAVNTNGNVILDASVGPIVTLAGALFNTIVSGTTITINGEVKTGSSNSSQVKITGDTSLSAGDILSIDVDGYTTAGTEYDQLVITGTVTITDASLNLTDNTGTLEDQCGSLILIDNDSTDPIVGTFQGIAEGGSVSFGNISGKVSYMGGDGNDFVLILDDTPPTALCQDITVQLDAAGTASIVATDVDGGSSDNCALGTLSVDVTAFTCADVGANTVTLTVPDVNGNSSTCTATVTVEDNVPPVAICQDITVQLDANGDASITAAAIDNGSNDACGVASLSISPSTFDCADVGANTVTLTVTDVNGNSSTCTSTVTVEDNVPPVAVCQDITVVLSASTGLVDITPADIDNGSTDACGIASLSLDQTQFDCAEVGSNTVTLTVTDNNGNTATCTATVTVEDNTTPAPVCQNVTLQLDATGNAVLNPDDLNGGSADVCGIDFFTASKTNFDCTDIGTQIVQLTVFDVNGNFDTCNAMVTVEDNIDPTAICQDITVSLDGSGNASIVPADVDGGSSDNCAGAVLTASPTSFDGSNLGDNNVTLTITDAQGMVSSCVAVVTIVDTTPPTAVCQDVSLTLDASGNATITEADIDNGSFDNVSAVTLALDQTNFDCSNIGANTVTLTVTDSQGLTDTCTATVTITDDLPPTVTCQDVTLELNSDGEAFIINNSVVASSNDNCGVDSISISNTFFSCDDLGENTVTVTVSDATGNTATCTATVTIEDPNGPVFDLSTVPGPQTRQADANNEYIMEDFTADVVAFDNCGGTGITVVAQNPEVDDVLIPGVYTVILTAVDEDNNTADVGFLLTINPTLGVSQQEAIQSLVLYPNPASNQVTLSNPNNAQLKSLTIYDLTGRVIKTVSLEALFSEKTIDISTLQSATYMIVIQGENSQLTKRLIVE